MAGWRVPFYRPVSAASLAPDPVVTEFQPDGPDSGTTPGRRRMLPTGRQDVPDRRPSRRLDGGRLAQPALVRRRAAAESAPSDADSEATMTSHLLDEVGLAPLARRPRPGRGPPRATPCRADDRFLGEVAGHLLAAGGKRLRPTLTLCAAYAAARRRAAAADDAVTGGAAVELVHLGSLYHDDVIDEAETRRGVPSVNARWSNIVAILAGDYLLAQASSLAASLGADVAALLADDDRRAVPRPGARAAAPLRRRPHRGVVPLRDRGQDRVADGDRVPRRRRWSATCRPTRSTRSRSSATTSACASRSSTTCSTSPAPRPSSASRPATTCTKACTRCR